MKQSPPGRVRPPSWRESIAHGLATVWGWFLVLAGVGLLLGKFL